MGQENSTARDDENLPAASKSKKKTVVMDDDVYSAGTELSEEPQEEKVVITGKKKGEKGTQKSSRSKDDVGGLEEEEDDVGEILFAGKKKPNGKKGGGNCVLAESQTVIEKPEIDDTPKENRTEEDRNQQEKLERLAELRKIKMEMEKLTVKTLEGKLLTRAEVKKSRQLLVAMKKLVMANAGDKERAPTKWPEYQTKKSKPAHRRPNGAAYGKMEENVDATAKKQEQQETAAELESEETDRVGDAESLTVLEKQEIDEAPKENGTEENDDDEEWDAESRDDVNLNVKGAFDDEENESKSEPPAKKEIKSAVPAGDLSPCIAL